MASQNSIINYVPQPYFIAGTCSVSSYVQIDTIENSSGLFNPDLSNYTTVVPNSGVDEFGITITSSKQADHISHMNVSAALIGCSMLTYEDSGGNPDLDTVFAEDIVCAVAGGGWTQSNQVITYAHSSQDVIHTFCQTDLPGIIAGGQTNLIFNGMGTFKTTPTNSISNFTFSRKGANVLARPHVRLVIGHYFIGADIPIIIDPNSFTWNMGVKTQRFFARDQGAISSEGTFVRSSSGQIIKIGNDSIVGSTVTDIATEIESQLVPNLFDLTKVNNSYPILFNPYPVGTVPVSSLTIEQANLTARQNFFSIYGFLDNAFELTPSEYRDGLDSEYKARFRIQETR
jgi:hypothetical protein